MPEPADTDTATAVDTIYVDVTQTADGRITHVALLDSPPDPDPLILSTAIRTVWQHTPQDGPAATEVFNLLCSDVYRDDNPSQWAQADTARTAFHAENAPERVFLRTVEAHLILAGLTTAHTAPATVETHGITLTDNGDTWVFCRAYRDAWQAAVRSSGHSIYDWSVLNEAIAPPTATAKEVADAIRALLADD
ncbi:hypothetical protein ABZ468_28405 [Streptomyces sp. NPDC005708]|uniref:hypothetical protein n=1 Tax=Streptomyces sp. NPDC005708 TaxID=3154564 RepID=UPI0033F994BE